jgi:hypothetical protein
MSASPAFASTLNSSSAVLAGFDASFTAPSTTATLITAASAGTIVHEIIVQGLATLSAGIVNIFIYTGSVYVLYDQVVLTTAPTASTSVAAFRAVRQYTNLILKTGYTLRVSHTTTGNDTSKLAVTVVGADLT